MGPEHQRRFAVRAGADVIHLHAAHGATGNQPVECGPGVVAGDAGRIGAESDRNAGLQHFLHRRRVAGGFDAVALSKVFPLKRHAVLHRNATAQLFNTIDIALSNRFRMVKEPVQAIKRNIAVDLLEDIQHPADRLVIGRMQAEWPAMLHQMPHYALQLIFHTGR